MELIPNKFTKYKLEPHEELQGSVFTETQRAVIQNILVDIAEEKLLLVYDIARPESFIQEDANKAGQIEILTYLLELSLVAEQQVLENARNNTQP